MSEEGSELNDRRAQARRRLGVVEAKLSTLDNWETVSSLLMSSGSVDEAKEAVADSLGVTSFEVNFCFEISLSYMVPTRRLELESERDALLLEIEEEG